MNLFITGGLGHIGSQMIREYAKREDIGVIRILDNLSTQRYCSLFNLPNKKYQFIEGDINNLEVLREALKDIDIVIHLAAITDAPSTIKNPELTKKVNLEGTKSVLQEAINANVKKFLFPSTTSVYGEAEGIVDENSPEEIYKPATPYAETKFESEKIVQNAYKETGINSIVLRKGTIFGASIGMRFHTAVNKFIYLACLNKPLTVWEDALHQKRPYLGLKDDIKAFEFLEKQGKPGELYNVLTGNYTVNEIVEAIKNHIPNLKIEMTKSQVLNQKSYTVSNQKIKNLGFEFQDKLDDSIKESVELFKSIENK